MAINKIQRSLTQFFYFVQSNFEIRKSILPDSFQPFTFLLSSNTSLGQSIQKKGRQRQRNVLCQPASQPYDIKKMKMVNRALLIVLSGAPLLVPAAAGEIFEIHGSGTTNPSKCIWNIMSKFNARSRDPIRMTYRAVGSSTGQAEFLGRLNTNNATVASHWPHVDFGAGDIPVPKEEFDALNDEAGGVSGNAKMVHLPFALSSVSFFYHLNGADKVDLSGCLLAKIFSRKITYWNDPEIVAVNGNLAKMDTKITVCRRTYGSSSTKSITQVRDPTFHRVCVCKHESIRVTFHLTYTILHLNFLLLQFLNKECELEWGSDKVGSALDNWDIGTTPVEGSGEMVECINEENGAIGYLESGHGWAESLQEISLQNLDGNYVTSKDAFLSGGITGAASEAMVPISASHDWSNVDFIDKVRRQFFQLLCLLLGTR